MAELNSSLSHLLDKDLLLSDKDQLLIVKELKEALYKILESKSPQDLTQDSKDKALVEVWKIINNKLDIANSKISLNLNILNNYQNVFFAAISSVNKNLKQPKLKINNNLFRIYCCVVFEKFNQRDLLYKLTGWNFEKVMKENITPDMKSILVSVINSNKEENEKEYI